MEENLIKEIPLKQLTDLMYFKYLYSIHDLMEFSDWMKRKTLL